LFSPWREGRLPKAQLAPNTERKRRRRGRFAWRNRNWRERYVATVGKGTNAFVFDTIFISTVIICTVPIWKMIVGVEVGMQQLARYI
jgi:hypothetical protein